MDSISYTIELFLRKCFSWKPSRRSQEKALELVQTEVWENRRAKVQMPEMLFTKAPSEMKAAALGWGELKAVSDAVAGLKSTDHVYNGISLRVAINPVDDLDKVRPNGALTKKLKGGLRATDIMVPVALSRTCNNKVNDDIRAVANRIMQKDFRRNFIYAIAVEDSHMTLWYFSHSRSIKSEPFDYMKDPFNLVTILVSLMFATERELGLDHRISFMPDTGFVYRLSEKPYLVVSVLNQKEDIAINASPRRTRVFQAIEIVLPTAVPPRTAIPIILKDTWIGASSPTESQIEQKVLTDVGVFLRQDDWKSIKFVEDLRVVPAKPEETLVKARTAGPESLLGGDKWKGLMVRSQQTSAGEPEKFQTANSDVAYEPRNLVRYQKEGIRVDRLPDVGEAMNVLNRGAYVLYVLFCAGWAHGDISINSIMGIENEATGEWNLLLGTFRDAQKFQPAESDENDEQIEKFMGDVEAIWWTAVFILSTRVETGTPKKKAKSPFKLNRDVKKALQIELDVDFLECLHEDLRPLAKKAEEFRARLKELGSGSPTKNEIYEAAHTFFSGITEDQKAWSKAAKLELKPFEPTFIINNPACEQRCKVANKCQSTQPRFTKRERPTGDDDGREEVKRTRLIGNDKVSPGAEGAALASRNTLEEAISKFKLPVGISESTWTIPTVAPSSTKRNTIGTLTKALPTPTAPSNTLRNYPDASTMLSRLASVSFAALALMLIQVATVSGSPVVNADLNSREPGGFDMNVAPPDSASGHGSAY
ncbi:hypothetical protein EST38_g2246 [Candolleomyces aberdarensis]|uniref:Fungal-type protein kinase domain-containing protein n=1 Tax=Candolleomyces aberdarensis TaxID=2316362 RepID=A0A4Q2DTB1_9AGAR|nr:hypothetical protein EST38_g2246 [Candolleomyces aberdarensis]